MWGSVTKACLDLEFVPSPFFKLTPLGLKLVFRNWSKLRQFHSLFLPTWVNDWVQRSYGEYLLINYLKVNAANHVKASRSGFLDCIALVWAACSEVWWLLEKCQMLCCFGGICMPFPLEQLQLCPEWSMCPLVHWGTAGSLSQPQPPASSKTTLWPWEGLDF